MVLISHRSIVELFDNGIHFKRTMMGHHYLLLAANTLDEKSQERKELLRQAGILFHLISLDRVPMSEEEIQKSAARAERMSKKIPNDPPKFEPGDEE